MLPACKLVNKHTYTRLFSRYVIEGRKIATLHMREDHGHEITASNSITKKKNVSKPIQVFKQQIPVPTSFLIKLREIEGQYLKYITSPNWLINDRSEPFTLPDCYC